VAFIQDRHLGHFTHVSTTALVVSALKNDHILSFLEFPVGVFNFNCALVVRTTSAMSQTKKNNGVLGAQ
jgi:hypothetical protein